MRALLLTLLLTTQAQTEPVSARLEQAARPGTCGAALLAPDLALTAAHCLRPDPAPYALRPPEGDPVRLTAVIRHPLHALAPEGLPRYRFDLAVATLAGPLDLPPLPVGPPPETGETLHIETWRRGEPAPARRACPVAETRPGLAVLLCAVRAGHSGAPVLRETEAGPEVVAVTVATLAHPAGPAAIVTVLADRLEVLLEAAGHPPGITPASPLDHPSGAGAPKRP